MRPCLVWILMDCDLMEKKKKAEAERQRKEKRAAVEPPLPASPLPRKK